MVAIKLYCSAQSINQLRAQSTNLLGFFTDPFRSALFKFIVRHNLYVGHVLATIIMPLFALWADYALWSTNMCSSKLHNRFVQMQCEEVREMLKIFCNQFRTFLLIFHNFVSELIKKVQLILSTPLICVAPSMLVHLVSCKLVFLSEYALGFSFKWPIVISKRLLSWGQKPCKCFILFILVLWLKNKLPPTDIHVVFC